MTIASRRWAEAVAPHPRLVLVLDWLVPRGRLGQRVIVAGLGTLALVAFVVSTPLVEGRWKPGAGVLLAVFIAAAAPAWALMTAEHPRRPLRVWGLARPHAYELAAGAAAAAAVVLAVVLAWGLPAGADALDVPGATWGPAQEATAAGMEGDPRAGEAAFTVASGVQAQALWTGPFLAALVVAHGSRFLLAAWCTWATAAYAWPAVQAMFLGLPA